MKRYVRTFGEYAREIFIISQTFYRDSCFRYAIGRKCLGERERGKERKKESEKEKKKGGREKEREREKAGVRLRVKRED